MRILILSLDLLIPFVGFSQSSTKFSKDEKKVIKAGKKSGMRVYTIDNFEDSILLRKPSFSIDADSSNKKLMTLIERMKTAMVDSGRMGVGIAAPQVGVLRSIIIVQRFDKEGYPIEAFVNPKIVSCSGEKIAGREGCLSIPNRSDTVFRQQDIVIQYSDWKGGFTTERVTGFTSVIFQHEIDHLNGILYIDHLRRED